MLKNPKTLVLGGTGYIGKYVFDYLQDYYVDIYRAGRQTVEHDLSFINLDLLDINQLENILIKYKFDYVINISGYVNISQEHEMFEKLIEGNVYTIRNLLKAIVKNNLNNIKVIHFSTMSVYGEAQYIPVDEEHQLNPVNLYGISKLTGEQIVKYYAQNYNIKSLILRIPGVFGGNRKQGAMYHFIKNALNNENININTIGLKSWSPIYINTLADMLKQLLNKYKWDKIYEAINISYGDNIDIIKTANFIKQELSSNAAIVIRKPIDYKKFFMSDKKLSSIITKKYSYKDDLNQYIEILRENLL